jgi:hypothetical protein
MHVSLRRRQVLMTRQLLNRPCRRASHRQVRAERVAEDVNARPDVCPSGGRSHVDLRDLSSPLQIGEWALIDLEPVELLEELRARDRGEAMLVLAT